MSELWIALAGVAAAGMIGAWFLVGVLRGRASELAPPNRSLQHGHAEVAASVGTDRDREGSSYQDRQFRSALETARDAFIGIDAAGRVREWNPQAEALFGWLRDEALGQPLNALILPERHRDANIQELERFLESGEQTMLERRLELPALHRDGHEFPVEANLWATRIEGECFFNALLHDISEELRVRQRSALSGAVSAIVVDSDSLAQAAPRILEVIGDAFGWGVGALWVEDPSSGTLPGKLRCAEFWHAAGMEVPAFEASSRSLRLVRGEGLPGIVWERAAAEWMADVATSKNFPRAAIAIESGISGGLAFPVCSDDGIEGVFEFFSQVIEKPDAVVLESLNSIGRLLGQFIERKRAEAALLHEKQFLQILLEQLSEGIVACDADGRLNIFNRATREWHGLPEATLPPEQWAEHFSLYRADGASLMPTEEIPLLTAFREGAVRGVEMVIAPRHMPRRTVLCNGQALIGPDGAKMGAVVAMHDISGRKAAQEALESARHDLAEAQRIATVGSWSWDVAEDRVEWSDELFRIYGLDRERWSPSYEGYLERVHADDREVVKSVVMHAMSTVQDFEQEHRIVRADGEVRVLRARGRAVVGDDGSVIRLVGTAQDITERRQQQQQMEQMDRFDAMTGLPNRRFLLETLRNTIRHAEETDQSVAVLMLGVDGFKKVNDALGRAVGDALLQRISVRLLHTLRSRDTLGRLGGDEFAAILTLPGDGEPAATVAAKLNRALREPFQVEGHQISISASIGIALYPYDTQEVVELLGFADVAMNAAKQAGKDTFLYHTAQMNQGAERRLELESALRAALGRREFTLHYQPKVEVASGRWVGVEALLRWHRPDHGMVSPAEFIPVLEETGLIVAVGEWIIDSVCAQIAQWQQSGTFPLPVAINISARQLVSHKGRGASVAAQAQSRDVFDADELYRPLKRSLEAHGIAGSLLELELTESLLVASDTHVVDMLSRLKSLGLRLSVDDFGTGYSSLSYLKRFPIDALKIDGSFLGDIGTNPQDAAITDTIVKLAHSMGLTAIAECVETVEQLDFLKACGCDQAQGYYFSRPLPAEALVEAYRIATDEADSRRVV